MIKVAFLSYQWLFGQSFDLFHITENSLVLPEASGRFSWGFLNIGFPISFLIHFGRKRKSSFKFEILRSKTLNFEWKYFNSKIASNILKIPKGMERQHQRSLKPSRMTISDQNDNKKEEKESRTRQRTLKQFQHQQQKNPAEKSQKNGKATPKILETLQKWHFCCRHFNNKQ